MNLILTILGAIAGKIWPVLLVVLMSAKASLITTKVSGATSTASVLEVLLGVALLSQLCQVLQPEYMSTSIDVSIFKCS